jgi:hypothetical protein
MPGSGAEPRHPGAQPVRAERNKGQGSLRNQFAFGNPRCPRHGTRRHFLHGVLLVPAGQGFSKLQNNRCLWKFPIDTQAWWLYHLLKTARVRRSIITHQ